MRTKLGIAGIAVVALIAVDQVGGRVSSVCICIKARTCKLGQVLTTQIVDRWVWVR